MTATNEQRMASLAKANGVRAAKKVAKEKLRQGEISLIAALSKPTKAVLELRMDELLLASPGIGRHKSRQILMRASVSPSFKLGQCSPMARKRVLQQVMETCPRVWGSGNA